MTCSAKNTQFDMAMELLIDNGFNGVAEAITLMRNKAMSVERSPYLQAAPYERTDQRRCKVKGDVVALLL